jgi:hypothetical protein
MFGERAEAGGEPVWIEIGDGWDRETLRVLAPRRHHLLGHRARGQSVGLAVVATGRVVPLPEAEPDRRQPGPTAVQTRCRLCCVMDRLGRVGWHLDAPGADCPGIPDEGLILDMMRRSLGLETPPPPCSPSLLSVMFWVEALADAAGSVPLPLEWADAVCFHPVAAANGVSDPAEAELAIRVDTARLKWSRLRHLTAADGPAAGQLGVYAGWMDDGMFARWVLAGIPSVGELMDLVRPVLTRQAARRMTDFALNL